jgi:hypothetical protein
MRFSLDLDLKLESPCSLTSREEVRGMFSHAFGSYMTYAYPKDELKPISCSGRSGKEDQRGTMDDSLGDFSYNLHSLT